MARKASDLFSLLASRSSHRRGGIFHQVASAVGSLFRSKRQSSSKKVVLSGLGFVAVCFVCAGIGYLLGDQFPMSPNRTLRAAAPEVSRRPEPQRPGPVENPIKTPVATGNAALYVGNFQTDKKQAEEVAAALLSRGFDKARAQKASKEGKQYWVVLVFYEGEAECDALQERLRRMPALPALETYRSDKKWPMAIEL